jgi:hypothetical protein
LILSSDRKLVLWEFKCPVSVSADPGADDEQTGSNAFKLADIQLSFEKAGGLARQARLFILYHHRCRKS